MTLSWRHAWPLCLLHLTPLCLKMMKFLMQKQPVQVQARHMLPRQRQKRRRSQNLKQAQRAKLQANLSLSPLPHPEKNLPALCVRMPHVMPHQMRQPLILRRQMNRVVHSQALAAQVLAAVLQAAPPVKAHDRLLSAPAVQARHAREDASCVHKKPMESRYCVCNKFFVLLRVSLICLIGDRTVYEQCVRCRHVLASILVSQTCPQDAE